ncbi:PIN2/TERF1-interacting telomerase inhibitor 1 isoform X2 [Alligator sinensis]|uniref:PIN2/TERF1-interacting telomerase inhibitor 1 isoform X2 n=1 Tax=Alligator sinensis TaxID=38654 RepID=A0A1U7S2R1_ALLSI|nr:PIN2/TERF1-interacting telomerase inhibitor 1 isoform X2 [Alligator sinensis]
MCRRPARRVTWKAPRMAMLAEPRRKQKWSVDPRNSAWSQDDSKFGQKMLEKMGWSKGKGLGAQEQGSTEHIKVQVKNNTLGLGAAISYEDNWIAHQDDFNQLLAELNSSYGQGETESPANEPKKTFSLEEKSKSSRKRVHYMKFAKGKDLSSRSEEDLSCIFGKRQKSSKTQEDTSSADSQEDNQNEDPGAPEPVDNTVTSTLTVQEYFAQRLAKLKNSHNGPKTKVADPCTAAAEVSELSEGLKTKPKKKKRSHKEVEVENIVDYEEAVVKRSKLEGLNGEKLDASDTESQMKKKKKKAKKRCPDRDDSCNGEPCVLPGVGEAYTGISDREDTGVKVSGAKQKKWHKKKQKKQKKEAAESTEDRAQGKKKKKRLS